METKNNVTDGLYNQNNTNINQNNTNITPGESSTGTSSLYSTISSLVTNSLSYFTGNQGPVERKEEKREIYPLEELSLELNPSNPMTVAAENINDFVVNPFLDEQPEEQLGNLTGELSEWLKANAQKTLVITMSNLFPLLQFAKEKGLTTIIDKCKDYQAMCLLGKLEELYALNREEEARKLINETGEEIIKVIFDLCRTPKVMSDIALLVADKLSVEQRNRYRNQAECDQEYNKDFPSEEDIMLKKFNQWKDLKYTYLRRLCGTYDSDAEKTFISKLEKEEYRALFNLADKNGETKLMKALYDAKGWILSWDQTKRVKNLRL